jgi:hypothetical protein
MLRRMILLAMAGLAVAAPPALASCHWNSQMKNASATASRDPRGCSIGAGAYPGSLLVTCPRHQHASFVYVFSSRHKVEGRASAHISATGWGGASSQINVKHGSVSVTVSVWGPSVQLNTVSIAYYTR